VAGPLSFSVRKITFGEGVKDFLELLDTLGISKHSKSTERRVRLDVESKIGKFVLPVGTSITVWPQRLRDLELDSHLASIRLDKGTLKVYVKRGIVWYQFKSEPSAAIPVDAKRIGPRRRRVD